MIARLPWLSAGLTAVAVWDHRPTPKELLDDRLARGWRPLPSPVNEGPKVLGYAACLASDDPEI